MKLTKKHSILLISSILILTLCFTALLLKFNYKKEDTQTPTSLTPTPTEIPAQITKATSCEDISEKIKNSRLYTGNKGYYPGPIFSEDPLFTRTEDKGSTSAPGQGTGSNQVSQTNVQVKGIDESDIVKTDGKYLYTLSNNSKILNIYDIKSPENTALVKQIELLSKEEKRFDTGEMFLYKEKLIVLLTAGYFISPASARVYIPDVQNYTTGLQVYNVADPSKPLLEKNIELEGYYKSSRMKDGIVQLISSKPINSQNISDPVPLIKDSPESKAIASQECDKIDILPGNQITPTITSILSLNLDEANKYSVNNYLGAADVVYVSNKNIYIAGTQYPLDIRWEGIPLISRRTATGNYQTQITKIAYDKLDLNIKASTIQRGLLLNQFSLDEYNDNLRAGFTITNTQDLSRSTNIVRVLDSELKLLGEIRDLGINENIYAIRFQGDTGLVVTYRQTDPVYTLDLSNPNDPKLKGELKIPGFSNYLHFIDEKTALGIGKEVNEKNFIQQGIKVALYDMSDMTNPKEIAKLEVGEQGSWSEALTNHKALTIDTSRGLLIFPAHINRIDPKSCDDFAKAAGRCYGTPSSQGAQIIRITPGRQLEFVKEISHNDLRNQERVVRSVIAGKYFITIGESSLKVTSESNLETPVKVFKNF